MNRMGDRWRDEEGAVTVFVVSLVTALLLLAGLLFDGGRILDARREAFALADNAARAAAQAVDLDAIRTGAAPSLDGQAAEAAARSYLDQLGHDGTVTVTVTGDRAHVTVSMDVQLALLSIVGMQARTVTGTGEARLVAGVTTGG